VTEVVGFGNDALERETKSSEFNEITAFRRPHFPAIVGEKSRITLIDPVPGEQTAQACVIDFAI